MNETPTPNGATETPSQSGLKSLCLPDNFNWQNVLLRYFLTYKDEEEIRKMIQEKFPETELQIIPKEKNSQQVKIKLFFQGQIVAKIETILPKKKLKNKLAFVH